MAFFFIIIIGHSRDFLRVISGFPGERGFKYFIIPSSVTVSLGIILRYFIKCLAPFYMAMF